ncbi:hypothetical protein IJ531_01720 [bacterium]|nr:hypothetical protein [bacterium]
MIEKINNLNFYNNKTLTKGLKLVSEHSALFTSGASLAFASVVRPVSTLLAPKTDKEDKKLSCIKSISSAITGFLFMALVSTPFSRAVKNIDNNPKEFLTPETISNLTKNAPDIGGSKSYKLITQLFKLGLAFLLAYPKALINNAIIPKISEKAKDKNKQPRSFTGKLENIISGVINNQKVQNFANSAQNTKYTTHLIALGDIFSTLAFTTITSKNKKLDNHQKKVLNLNAIISTALCLIMGYGADKALDKPMEKFIKNLGSANKNSPDLAKYIEGSNIVKTSLIFGIIYYCLIPVVSTFISSKLAKSSPQK